MTDLTISYCGTSYVYEFCVVDTAFAAVCRLQVLRDKNTQQI